MCKYRKINKKIQVLLLLGFIFLTGCNSKKDTVKPKKEEIKPQEQEIIEEEKYIDNNPIKVGIYEEYNKLVKEYYTEKTSLKDLFFSTFYTNDEYIVQGYVKNRFINYMNNYENVENYKIGYTISFYVGDKYISKTITKITDEYVFNPYFYIYLYDDVHQEIGAWYSHLTTNDVKDYNLFTSIKLYLVEIDKVTSPITLTAFTYDSEDDFDDDGNYRGNSKYTITINWK